jgi:hypothetical protein
VILFAPAIHSSLSKEDQVMNKNGGKRGSSVCLMLAICLTAVLSVGLLSKSVPTGYGYAADGTCRITGLGAHSTFHYEFTRVLAVAAGFNETDAETIAVANEATDSSSFEGYPVKGEAIIVAFDNTQRLAGANATLWYHMPRRSEGFPIVTQPNGKPYRGAMANTCGYFTKPFTQPIKAPCDHPNLGELDQLRAWAINGATLPAGKAPKVIEGNMNSTKIPHDDATGYVIGQNVYALGIYLHAVGDSYSHEKCMMNRHIRAHVPRPYECKGIWHVTSEFGDYQGPQEEARGAGVPYTLTAAKAIWQEILKYRVANGLGASKWDENRYMEFAKDFIATKTAALRVRKAVGEFNRLTGETATPQACPSSSARKSYVVN